MLRPLIFLNILLGSFQAIAVAYIIDTSKSTQTLKQNERGLLIISVKIEPKVHLNQEAPIKLVLEKNLALQFTKTTMNEADLEKKTPNALQFQFPFQAQATGKHVIKGELHFYLCGADACNAIKETLSYNIEVTP